MLLRVGEARLRAPRYGAQRWLMSLRSLEEGGEASRSGLTFQASEGWRPQAFRVGTKFCRSFNRWPNCAKTRDRRLSAPPSAPEAR